ncbi:MAG: sigma 54-interacting transcriptional regulator, partial [Bacteroidota bacterium]
MTYETETSVQQPLTNNDKGNMKAIARRGSGRDQRPGMQDISAMIERIAASNMGVLIVGEPGTGKEWTARNIHRLSLYAGKQFHAVDCSTLLPDMQEREFFGQEVYAGDAFIALKGFLEESNEGTLFITGFESLP